MDQRVLLRTVEELESARIFLVTIGESVIALILRWFTVTLTSTGGAAFWRLVFVKRDALKKSEKSGIDRVTWAISMPEPLRSSYSGGLK
jgi:hypothetical protein